MLKFINLYIITLHYNQLILDWCNGSNATFHLQGNTLRGQSYLPPSALHELTDTHDWALLPDLNLQSSDLGDFLCGVWNPVHSWVFSVTQNK